MYLRSNPGIFLLIRFAIVWCIVVLGTNLPPQVSFSADLDQSGHYLLLDSRIVESIERVHLSLGQIKKCAANPLFGADRPWEVRMDNLYPNVIYDRPTKRFHCWYSPFIVDPATTDTPAAKRAELTYLEALNRIGSDKREMAICYATSADGLHWQKPALGIYDYAGSNRNNIVLRLPPHGPHGAGVLHDDHDDLPARRFKTFFSFNRGLRLAGSADGIRWSPPVDCPGVQVPGDTHNCLLWAPTIGKYVGFTRTWDGVRQVARSESVDLKTWTPAKVVLQGVDPHHQTYAMQVFQYSGVYLGLLMILDTEADTVQCELAWSPDTLQWHRVCPGQALIGNGPEGSYDWGCVYASSPIFQEDRSIRLYYGGGNGRHGDWRDSFLCCAELSPDHWAGYQPDAADASGHIITRPLPITSNHMELTADAANGSIHVSLLGDRGEVLADSKSISVNVTDGKVTWKQPESIARLIGRNVRLRFELKNATLFAFRYDKKPEGK